MAGLTDNDKAILLLAAMIELSDRARTAMETAGGIATMGALLALHNSIQKHRPRIIDAVKSMRVKK